MHIFFAASAVLLTGAFIGFGAAALGRGFLLYWAITVISMPEARAIVGTQITVIAAGQPTPWMGLIECISVYGPIVWLRVFALALFEGLDGHSATAPGQHDERRCRIHRVKLAMGGSRLLSMRTLV